MEKKSYVINITNINKKNYIYIMIIIKVTKLIKKNFYSRIHKLKKKNNNNKIFTD